MSKYAYLPEETKKQITTEASTLKAVFVASNSIVVLYDTSTGVESEETKIASLQQPPSLELVRFPDVTLKHGLYAVTHGTSATVFYS